MGYSHLGGFDFMFNAIMTIVVLGFVLVFGIIIVTLVRGGIEWNKNNNSPILDVTAKIVAKRMSVRNRNQHYDDATVHHLSASTYFVTFEVDSGDRIELLVPDKEYGLLVEGDIGKLTFQGTRYKAFKRDRTIHAQNAGKL